MQDKSVIIVSARRSEFPYTELEVLAKKFKENEAHQSGDDGDEKIGGRKNVMDCVREALPLPVPVSKFAH